MPSYGGQHRRIAPSPFHCVNHGIIYEKTLLIVVADAAVVSSDYAHGRAAISAVQQPHSLWIQPAGNSDMDVSTGGVFLCGSVRVQLFESTADKFAR